MFLYLFVIFIVIQRLIELKIAKKNAKYLQSLGGYQLGEGHYPLIVSLHVAFIFSLLIEGLIVNQLSSFWVFFFLLFIAAQLVRLWVISSLGKFWNTRIYILPNSIPIKSGPYKYVKHPNYIVVMVEMITIPLIFGAHLTAVVFPILNAIILTVRIKEEEKALALLVKK